MTSARQRTANRANAGLSTGPKTAKGKARAAKNALRHGLSLSVLTDPTLAKEVETLAERLAGPRADRALLAQARWVAEAQIDLRRVRFYRTRRMAQIFGGTTEGERDNLALGPRATVGPEAITSVIGTLTRELEALDRYERCARSRRKFAVRALDQWKIHRKRAFARGKTRQ